MIRFLGAVLAVVVFGYLGTFVGWWGLALIAGIVGFVVQDHGVASFFSGFLGGALFFGIYAYLLDTANESRLSSMMSEVLTFDPFLPTVLIGALLGAMGMLTGKYLRDALLGEKRIVKYRGKYS